MSRTRRGKGLDSVDYAILRALRDDARLPNYAISRRLGISHVTVRDRLERLLREGYLRILPVADPRAFGYEREVEILLNLEPQTAWPLAQALADEPAVRRLSLITGAYDAVVNAVFSTEEELYAFLRRVAERPGVRGMQTQHVVQSFKQEHDWLAVPEEPAPATGVADGRLLAVNGGTLDPAFLAGLQLAGRWLAALIGADTAALAELSTEDVEFDVLPPTPLSGRYAGKEALAHHARAIRRDFPISSAHIVRARPGTNGDDLLVRWDATAVQADGTVQHGERLMRANLRNGLVRRVVDGRADGVEPAADGWLETQEPGG